MNKYFALRKTNRMRTELLTEKSQEQLKEEIRYLRRVSWDFCGIELVRSDLLDIAIQANTVPPDDGTGGLSAAGALAEICCMAGALYRNFVWNGLVLYPDRGQSRVVAASDS